MGPASLSQVFSEGNRAKSSRAGHLTSPGFQTLERWCSFPYIGVHSTHTHTHRNKMFCLVLKLSIALCSEIPAGDVGLYDLPDFYTDILLDKLD